jgi:hypothetical protein
MPSLRVLPTEQLIPDPDVQIDHTLEERRVDQMIENWNPSYVVVLVVAPLPSKDGFPKYGIIDGRHRFLAGKARGVKEWRCDVHSEVRSVQEKAALKLAIDRDRRRVSPLEHFLERVKMKEPVAVEIKAITEGLNFEIGKLSKGKPYHRIETVNALDGIYQMLGPDELRRTLTLNTHWREDPKANTSHWIRALGLLVRDDYDLDLTPAQWKRLTAVVPAKALRQAQGEAEIFGTPGTDRWGGVAYALAKRLRKTARLRSRPPIQKEGGSRAYPL